MVNEVNKLILNALTDGISVYIPEVGTIAVTRTAAKKMRRGRVAPPCYNLFFTTEQRGESVANVINSSTGLYIEEAEDIARRWQSKVTEDGRVVIEGVGAINRGQFTPDDNLLNMLEENNDAVMLTKKKGNNRKAWLASVIVACLLGIGAYLYLYWDETARFIASLIPAEQPATDETNNEPAPAIEVTEAEQTAATEEQPTEQIEPNETVTQAPVYEPVVEQTQQQTPVAIDYSDWRNTSVRNYVIFGSYSNMTNANKAVRKIMRKNPAAQCKIIPLGHMHAVAVYGSYYRRDCETFKRNHRTLYKDAWIHTPKRFR